MTPLETRIEKLGLRRRGLVAEIERLETAPSDLRTEIDLSNLKTKLADISGDLEGLVFEQNIIDEQLIAEAREKTQAELAKNRKILVKDRNKLIKVSKKFQSQMESMEISYKEFTQASNEYIRSSRACGLQPPRRLSSGRDELISWSFRRSATTLGRMLGLLRPIGSSGSEPLQDIIKKSVGG